MMSLFLMPDLLTNNEKMAACGGGSETQVTQICRVGGGVIGVLGWAVMYLALRAPHAFLNPWPPSPSKISKVAWTQR